MRIPSTFFVRRRQISRFSRQLYLTRFVKSLPRVD